MTRQEKPQISLATGFDEWRDFAAGQSEHIPDTALGKRLSHHISMAWQNCSPLILIHLVEYI
jgi:hypothetical protein